MSAGGALVRHDPAAAVLDRVPLSYGDPGAEYDAYRRHAIVVDRSHRGRMVLSGPAAAGMLNGLVTNDVSSLAPGHGCYAVALTAKGRIVADLRVFNTSDGLLVDAPARAFDGWMAVVKKYINPRMAPYRDVSATTRSIGVFGAQARHVVEQMTGVSGSALALLPAYGFAESIVDGEVVRIAHVPELGNEGFDLFGSESSIALMRERSIAARATPAGMIAWEVARVEAGRPEFGIDMDDTTLPQEANMDELQAISYTKGCYTGQEVVARVHFRGHVNRHLRGLRVAGMEAPPPGATLVDDEGKAVGDVRSAVSSPTLGGIGLGMVRREVEPGTSLHARWEGGEERDMRVDVVPVPFAVDGEG
ncbi:MAG: folate-binding protein YgfZ [Gemmatimonadetes bacterium]|nr:folate-binding protein YgfZ [Gemmatimonadota bacterium]